MMIIIINFIIISNVIDEMVSVLSYLREAPVTMFAGVGPLSSVGVTVAPQVSRGREAFITNLAGVRLPS